LQKAAGAVRLSWNEIKNCGGVTGTSIVINSPVILRGR
jgi:hypothetical protein